MIVYIRARAYIYYIYMCTVHVLVFFYNEIAPSHLSPAENVPADMLFKVRCPPRIPMVLSSAHGRVGNFSRNAAPTPSRAHVYVYKPLTRKYSAT